jgi:hypothetical protein
MFNDDSLLKGQEKYGNAQSPKIIETYSESYKGQTIKYTIKETYSEPFISPATGREVVRVTYRVFADMSGPLGKLELDEQGYSVERIKSAIQKSARAAIDEGVAEHKKLVEKTFGKK